MLGPRVAGSDRPSTQSMDAGHAGAEEAGEEVELTLREKAEAGDADAQYALALGLIDTDDGRHVSEAERDEATLWFKAAAEKGHARAQAYYGCALVEGQGVPADPIAGVRWLSNAAQRGSVTALAKLTQHAAVKAVAAGCCIACGTTYPLHTCKKCGVARYCSHSCLKDMWPTHIGTCKEWQKEKTIAGS